MGSGKECALSVHLDGMVHRFNTEDCCAASRRAEQSILVTKRNGSSDIAWSCGMRLGGTYQSLQSAAHGADCMLAQCVCSLIPLQAAQARGTGVVRSGVLRTRAACGAKHVHTTGREFVWHSTHCHQRGCSCRCGSVLSQPRLSIRCLASFQEMLGVFPGEDRRMAQTLHWTFF